MHVTDAASGERAGLGRAGRPWLMRLCVCLRGSGESLSVDDVRVLIVADVLRRVGEGLSDAQAVTALLTPALVLQSDLVVRVLDALRIPAFDAVVNDAGDLGEVLGAGPVVMCEAARPLDAAGARQPRETSSDTDQGRGGVRLRTGSARWDGTWRWPDFAGRDAAALRFALLTRPYSRPVTLGADALADAGAELTRLREQVACWAEQPSAGIPAPTSAALFERLTDDLDTPGVVDLLRGIACDPHLSAGAKFEAFVAADRFLALDLSAHLGR